MRQSVFGWLDAPLVKKRTLLQSCFKSTCKKLKNYSVQIFATDIDSQAIATARAGVYSVSIKADVSSERLTRFLQKTVEIIRFSFKKDSIC